MATQGTFPHIRNNPPTPLPERAEKLRNTGELRFVLMSNVNIGLLPSILCLAAVANAQTPPSPQTSAPTRTSGNSQANAKAGTTAKHDAGSGAGDIGKGAAKGVGSAAKGTGKAAADLVTLHPINAATDLGKGAANTGKNVGVGAIKGSAKIFKGAGKAIKNLL